VNGLSTSLPEEIQRAILQRIPGLESARMIRPGYAIEYDFVQPTGLSLSLESLSRPGLFMAGQINGTTGYEEAAAQGLMAGVNAVRGLRGEDPVILDRAQAYIGIMIDDLVTRGTNEPYRMFTSRAEFRLNLRIDNADARLTPLGRRVGLVGEAQWEAFEASRERIEALSVRLGRERVRADHPYCSGRGLRFADTQALESLLRRHEVRLEEMLDAGLLPGEAAEREERMAVETAVKYAGYLRQQDRQIERLRKAEARTLPPDLDFRAMPGLSVEIVEKLSRSRPRSFAQASRIPGMTPAALSILLLHLDGHSRARAPSASR
jgi:tRNA uridine 5-carboxymethylaminomethyl modification enzyme